LTKGFRILYFAVVHIMKKENVVALSDLEAEYEVRPLGSLYG